MGVSKNQLHSHKNREIARINKKSTYDGSACPKCNTTLRWTANYGCVNCGHIKGRELAKSPQGKKWAFNSRIRKKFGLEPSDYQYMLNSQNEKCAICFGPFNHGRYQKPYVDHDHETNKVRMLLCHKCNSILGYVNDNISILESAISYLKKHGKT